MREYRDEVAAAFAVWISRPRSRGALHVHHLKSPLMPTAGTHLDSLTRVVLQNSDDADRLIHEFSSDQLLWRPSPHRWSVAEWFEYLVAFGEDCQARIREPMLAAWHDPAFEDAPYKRTLIGGWSALGARVRGKRARGHVVPPPATVSSAARFVAQQSELLDLLDEAREVDLRGIHIGSLFSRLMGPCLGDVLERLIARQRHGVAQAEAITRMSGFPQGARGARHTPAGMLQTA
jgi:hypothetical protein